MSANFLGPVSVIVDGARATGRGYYLIVEKQEAAKIAASGEYTDEFVKIGNRWLIARRVQIIDPSWTSGQNAAAKD